MEGILHDTKQHKPHSVHMKALGRSLVQRTGLPGESPVLDGVITNTKHAIPDKNVPELHKVHHKGKTQARSMGQIAFAGPLY